MTTSGPAWFEVAWLEPAWFDPDLLQGEQEPASSSGGVLLRRRLRAERDEAEDLVLTALAIAEATALF